MKEGFDSFLLIETEALQPLYRCELFLRHCHFVRSQGLLLLKRARIRNSGLYQLEEGHRVALNRLKYRPVVLLETAHDTLIGCVVLRHLQEKLLVVRVRDQSYELPIDARGESELCVRLRLLTGRSSLLTARQEVNIAL